MNLHGWKRTLTIALGTVVILAMLVTVGLLAWPDTSGQSADQQQTSQPTSESAAPGSQIPDPPVTLPAAAITPMTPSDKAPTPAGITDALDATMKEQVPTQEGPESDKKVHTVAISSAVADLAGVVIDPVTGETLWEQKGDQQRLPASSMKVLTAAALLASADPNDRLETKVVQGDEPGTIVFVGGGDVTLSAAPEGTKLALPGGPTVADIAAQIKEADIKVTKIVLDTSYWSGQELASGWMPSDVKGTLEDPHGYVTRMSALMVDDDRTDPSVQYSPRTGDPAMTAGKALAHALGVDDVPIEEGHAAADADVLAKVQSQPLSTLLAQALERSDNVLAEALARQVAIARGAPPSFSGISAAVLQALGDMGVDTTGVVIKDGSGMSVLDRVPTRVLAEVMAKAVGGDDTNQRLLLAGLPIAGVSGTLAENDRYQQKATKAGRGRVRAKTGSIVTPKKVGYYALVGYVPDVDGRILVFAFNSRNVAAPQGRYAQDALATALRGCGCSGS